jgi:PIN domain nuclease of toxin-antitoxin system
MRSMRLIESALGKLPIPTPAVDYIVVSLNRLNALPPRVPHLAELERLPPVHRNPFDRLVIAQARAESMAILCGHPLFRKYEVRVL